MAYRGIPTKLAELASAQHGVVTALQAVETGMTRHQIERLVGQGFWWRLTRGCYAVSGSPSTWHQRVMAACLSTDGVASGVTAGRLHGLRSLPDDDRVHVTVDRGRSVRSSLAVVHAARDLHLDDPAYVDRIPATGIPRTLLDVAAVSGPVRFPRILDDALDRHLTTIAELDACLTRHRKQGRPGVLRMATALMARGDGAFATESVLERRFLELCDSHGLPRPRTQVRLACRGRVFARCDCVWAEARLIVELDGRRGHTQLTNRELDSARDQEAAALGWRVMRVTWHQVTREPAAVADRVRRALTPTLRF